MGSGGGGGGWEGEDKGVEAGARTANFGLSHSRTKLDNNDKVTTALSMAKLISMLIPAKPP